MSLLAFLLISLTAYFYVLVLLVMAPQTNLEIIAIKQDAALHWASFLSEVGQWLPNLCPHSCRQFQIRQLPSEKQLSGQQHVPQVWNP